MKTFEEIRKYINSNAISGRYERKLIREYMLENFPEKLDGINFFIPRIRQENEITFKDFLKFVKT